MELWASGFNAWGQLDFEELPETAPRDLKEFKCILRDEYIEIIRTTLSATLGRYCASLVLCVYFSGSSCLLELKVVVVLDHVTVSYIFIFFIYFWGNRLYQCLLFSPVVLLDA